MVLTLEIMASSEVWPQKQAGASMSGSMGLTYDLLEWFGVMRTKIMNSFISNLLNQQRFNISFKNTGKKTWKPAKKVRKPQCGQKVGRLESRRQGRPRARPMKKPSEIFILQ